MGSLRHDPQLNCHSRRWERLLRSGYLEVGSVSLLVSTVGPLVRVIDLPIPVLALGRFVFAWLSLSVGRVFKRHRTRHAQEGCRVYLALIGFCTAGGLLCFMAAFRLIPVAKAVLLAFCFPVITAVLAHQFLGEQIRRLAVAALILSGAGAALIVIPDTWATRAGDWRGMVLALASAFLGAVEVTMIKKIANSVSNEMVNLYRFGTAAILVAPFAFAGDWHITLRDAMLVAMLGIVHTALAGTVYVMGLRKAAAHKAVVLSYLEPLSATILAWIFLSEQPGLFTLLGGGLILSGSYLVIRSAIVTC
ncbi:MAG: DMT family transporter [Candidatus Hadarchaeum sp.]